MEPSPSQAGDHGVSDAFTASRVWVVIPTYNEREALTPIVSKVRRCLPRASVLIVDDASPDGTGELADELAALDSHLRVLHRETKSGLGDAYLAAFDWCLTTGADVVIEMDADGSHPAEVLPQLVAALERGADLAIGSRWVPGGTVVNWPARRRFISRAGNRYARMMLGVRVTDATAGFRAFRASALRALHLDDVASHGYCFQIDLTRRAQDARLSIVEVPIEFREREVGVSKMSTGIVVEAMARVTVWGCQRAWRGITGGSRQSRDQRESATGTVSPT